MCKKCGSNNIMKSPIFGSPTKRTEFQFLIGYSYVCVMCGMEQHQEIFKRYQSKKERNKK